MANAMRGRGDNMGVAGALNDKADITAPVRSYWPNEYGLYCMAGNVNEWVMDVYRDMTFDDMNEFRPFRGNVYTDYEIIIDPRDGTIELTPEAENYFDYSGRILRKPVRDEECFNRENYSTADNRNYLDGDLESLIPSDPVNPNWNSTGVYGVDTLKSKVKPPIDSINMNNLPPGSVISPNNDYLILPNKVKINLTDNTYILPSGHERLPTGEVSMPDGSMILGNGVIQLADGSKVHPDVIWSNRTTKMYNEGEWGNYGEWGRGEYDSENSKNNKGTGMTSLVSDRSRVFKGGSWKDRAYWLIPGTRRYLDEKMARADLGFRCAMTRVGGPTKSK